MNIEVTWMGNERRPSIRPAPIQYERRHSIKTVVIKKCCFCLDLRTGCIVIAMLTILAGLSTLIRVPFTWYMIFAAVTGSLSGSLLLYGAIRSNITATTSYLVMEVIGIIAYLLATSFIFIETQISANEFYENDLTKTAENTRMTGDLIGILFVFIILLHIYFWICGFRFLKQLRLQQLW